MTGCVGEESHLHARVGELTVILLCVDTSNGTSMISLIIPPKDMIARVNKMLGDEYGTASNIKSRVNRLRPPPVCFLLFLSRRLRQPRFGECAPGRSLDTCLFVQGTGWVGRRVTRERCRLSVLSAITSTQQRLKLYNKVPPNGLVLYCGTVLTEDGKERQVTLLAMQHSAQALFARSAAA